MIKRMLGENPFDWLSINANSKKKYSENMNIVFTLNFELTSIKLNNLKQTEIYLQKCMF